jgi:hypothetical protein
MDSMALHSKTDFFAGLMFAGFGTAALVLGRGYAVGSASQMGPGYYPTAIGLVLLVLGIAITLRALVHRNGDEPARPFQLRTLATLTFSVVGFALLIDRIGLLVSGVLLVIGCRLAAPGFRWAEVLVLGAVLAGCAALIFGLGLGIPFRLWPL